MTLLNDITELKEVLKGYSYKLSNNYLLPAEVIRLINNSLLTYEQDNDGVYIYERRDGYHKLFFHLNGTNAKLPVNSLPLVTNIVYRQGRRNEAVVEWLAAQGFMLKAKRIHLTAETINVQPSFDGISYATPQESLDFFSKCFVPLFSDLLLPESYGRLLAVRDHASRPIGIIHIDTPVCIAVSRDARRQGIATRLFAAYLHANSGSEKERICKLWSDPDNEAAQGLYKKLGFAADGLHTECYVRSL